MAGLPLACQSGEERKQKWDGDVGASCGSFNKSMAVIFCGSGDICHGFRLCLLHPGFTLRGVKWEREQQTDGWCMRDRLAS